MSTEIKEMVTEAITLQPADANFLYSILELAEKAMIESLRYKEGMKGIVESLATLMGSELSEGDKKEHYDKMLEIIDSDKFQLLRLTTLLNEMYPNRPKE